MGKPKKKAHKKLKPKKQSKRVKKVRRAARIDLGHKEAKAKKKLNRMDGRKPNQNPEGKRWHKPKKLPKKSKKYKAAAKAARVDVASKEVSAKKKFMAMKKNRSKGKMPHN